MTSEDFKISTVFSASRTSLNDTSFIVGTTLSASAQEKIYLVLDGTLHIENGETELSLGKWDSCRIAPGEDRRLINKTNSPVMVLLAMPVSADERRRAYDLT